jgi:hypothetical protein
VVLIKVLLQIIKKLLELEQLKVVQIIGDIPFERHWVLQKERAYNFKRLTEENFNKTIVRGGHS